MDPKWYGPFYIHDLGSHDTFKLRTMDDKLRKKFVHADQLRPYVDRDSTKFNLPTINERI